MALRKCKECGGQVAASARQCPHCGAKQPKKAGVLGWIIAGIVGVIIYQVATAPVDTAPRAPREPTVLEQALPQVTLEAFSWRKGGFDSVMVADFTIRNGSPIPVKDITIVCTSMGPSGTRLGRNEGTIFEVIAPGKVKRVRDFNMGFQHTQASQASCEVKRILPG